MDLFSYLLAKRNGGGGTTNYNDLSNLPQINNITLEGNKSLSDLGIKTTNVGVIENNSSSNPLILENLEKGLYDMFTQFPFYYKLKSTDDVKTMTAGYTVGYQLLVLKTVKEIEDYFEENPGITSVVMCYIYEKQSLDGYYARRSISVNRDGTTTHTYTVHPNDVSFLTSENQTIKGTKTFNKFPVTPSSAPTSNYQVANKKYVDDKIGDINTILATLTTPGGN